MYSLVTTNDFDKHFNKLDRSVQVIIKKWITKHLIGCEDPRAFGKPLSNNLKGYWRYRIGNYRLLVEINDDKLIIVAIDIGHRSEIYIE